MIGTQLGTSGHRFSHIDTLRGELPTLRLLCSLGTSVQLLIKVINSLKQFIELWIAGSGLAEQLKLVLLKETLDISISREGTNHEQDYLRIFLTNHSGQLHGVETIVYRHH